MLSRISVKSDEPRRPPLGPKLLPRCHRHDNSCSLGVIDNITTGGSDSLNLYHSTRGRPDSFDTVRSRHFSPIGAVLRLSAVPATAGASGKGIWCSGWLKHDQLSTLCWPLNPLRAVPEPHELRNRHGRWCRICARSIERPTLGSVRSFCA